MTQAELQRQLDILLASFYEIDEYFITKIATQIAEIGELTASTMNMIEVWSSMYEDISTINRRIAQAANVTAPQLHTLYQRALNDVYRDERFERALKETELPDSSRRALERYTESMSRQSINTMQNYANTTAVSQTYVQTVDKAILAVSSGLTDYSSAMRQSIRELGSNGLQVVYESGARRRLDTALRQNIVDGVHQIQQHASDVISEDLGYDAKEISVHANSAPDHEPVQGHVFMLDEFDHLQNDEAAKDIDGRFYPAMKRAIGEWNCMHFAFGFSTKYSKRKYTNEQLDEFARKNAEGCEIDGKHYSLYEASQLMRKIETEIRRQKDIGVAAQAAGDDALRQEAQEKINALSAKYGQVAKTSGLAERRDRMRVEGFKMYKPPKQPKRA